MKKHLIVGLLAAASSFSCRRQEPSASGGEGISDYLPLSPTETLGAIQGRLYTLKRQKLQKPSHSLPQNARVVRIAKSERHFLLMVRIGKKNALAIGQNKNGPFTVIDLPVEPFDIAAGKNLTLLVDQNTRLWEIKALTPGEPRLEPWLADAQSISEIDVSRDGTRVLLVFTEPKPSSRLYDHHKKLLWETPEQLFQGSIATQGDICYVVEPRPTNNARKVTWVSEVWLQGQNRPPQKLTKGLRPNCNHNTWWALHPTDRTLVPVTQPKNDNPKNPLTPAGPTPTPSP